MEMPDKSFRFYEVKRVFLACAGDLTVERSRFPRLLERVNTLRAHTLGIHFEAVGWERVIPAFGRPQALINEELRMADLVVVMLWNRIGTPAGAAGSLTGTQEEFKLACELFGRYGRPLVWIYFRRPTVEGGAQVDGVAAFRRELEAGRELFFREFAEPEDWEEMFAQHLVAFLEGSRRWDIERNRQQMRPERALLHGSFAGEAILADPWHGDVLLAADLDGDGTEERIVVSTDFHGAQHYVTKGHETYGLPSSELLAAFDPSGKCGSGGVFDDAKTVHVAIRDVNNDGFPEILLAAQDGGIGLRLVIWGLSDEAKRARALSTDCFRVIGELTGQTRAYVLEGGTIVMPYGTAGCASRHRWSGSVFETDDIILG
jgi:hypothetical protein